MNILTDPLFLVRAEDGTRMRVSYRSILLGEFGLPFDAPDPIQDLGQVFLGSALNTALFDGIEPGSPAEVERVIAENVPHFELLGHGPRFMQSQVAEAAREEKRGTEFLQVLLIGTPGGSTKTPFRPRDAAGEPLLCLPCASLSLFMFQMMVPGAGKGSSGIYSHGALTYLDEGHSARKTLWANTMVHPSDIAVFMWEELAATEPPHAFPWLDPEYHALLDVGQDASTVPKHFLNLRYMQFWMPRAVWFESTATDSHCHVCGMHTTVGISAATFGGNHSVKENRPKRGSNKKQSGAMKWPLGLIPSPFSPHTVQKTRVASKMPSQSRLLSSTVEFLQSSGNSRSAPVIAQRWLDGTKVRAVKVLGMSAQTHFEFYYVVDIPINEEPFEQIARRATLMKEDSDEMRKTLYSGIRHVLEQANDSKARQNALALADAWQEPTDAGFTEFLAPRTAEDVTWEESRAAWRSYLRATALEFFRRFFLRHRTNAATFQAAGLAQARIIQTFPTTKMTKEAADE